MKLSEQLLNSLIEITSNSAIACYPYIGKNEKILADKAATDVMRDQLNKLNIKGKVVIGEGELDEAPMLYIGETLGNGNGPDIDIAVDPVEGTNFVAKNLPGSMSVLAVAEKGNLLNAPETYMDKIVTGNHIPRGSLDIDFTVEKNINIYSDITKKKNSDITVCILNRPRHNKIISELRRLDVNIKFITDGDVSGALLVSDKKFNVDIFMGIGGGPEGVIAAAALDNLNCNFQGRFLFETTEDKNRAYKMGIKDLNKKYEIYEIVKGESIFCATGITSGDLMKGVIKQNNKYITETIITHNKSELKLIKKEVSLT
ncbi:class II fructose-bisphosphatase [Candidatus Pelagibacter sp.]|nr:class II fructose-bisphosphatase [Candidatus Pelagibacter sp.]